MPRALRLTILLLGLGCAKRAAPELPAALPFAVDTLRTESLSPGVVHRYLWAPAGPWAMHVLAVDLDRCYSVVAVKGADGARGRKKTSTLLAELSRTRMVVGAVNGDFFTPSGIPAGALISRGSVVTGPSAQPVLVVDSSGALHITTLGVAGVAVLAGRPYEIRGWNRSVQGGLSRFDRGWGDMTDTASGSVEVVLHGANPARPVLVDTTAAGVSIPGEGAVLVAARGAPAPLREALLALGADDTVRTLLGLTPWHPREAVGGRPVLLRDSVIPAGLDSSGGMRGSFAASRHPRTAVGLARHAKRLLLVTVDGRQSRYSDGMTLLELARLLRALGASDALNLDGGGSTTMVRAGMPPTPALEVVNHPSDAQGERAVGNALAVVRGCEPSRGR